MPLVQKCLTYLALQYLAQNLLKHTEREHTCIQLSLHKLCRILCSNCRFSVLSLNSFKFFKVNDNNDENALLGWPCWSCGVALLESDLCCLRDNFSFTWNSVKITFLSTGMLAHCICGLTSNCVTQWKESWFTPSMYLVLWFTCQKWPSQVTC